MTRTAAQLDYKSPDTRFAARSEYVPALHRLAVLTTVATFPLIFLGGLVTSHGAGMSVPDWPNSYGYNMFTFPPSKWIGGILYEHTHRLMGTVVGILSIALTVVAWSLEPRRWVRWLATSVLAAVILQGVLGGLRVIWVDLNLAVVHGCFAQAFFCLAALIVVVTSRWWHGTTEDPPSIPQPRSRRLAVLAVACVFAVFAQLILGALMRHYGAGLAIPDLPLAYGNVLPPLDAEALDAVNKVRAWDYHLDSVSLGQVWLHFGHRVGAVVVTIALSWLIAGVVRAELASCDLQVAVARSGPQPASFNRNSQIENRTCAGAVAFGAFATMTCFLVCLGLAHAVGSTRGVLPGAAFFAIAVASALLAIRLFRRLRTRAGLIVPGAMLASLLLVQLALGILTVLYGKPADVASAHVAVGALVLLTTFTIAVRAARVAHRERPAFSLATDARAIPSEGFVDFSAPSGLSPAARPS